jgi:hypothetical protein
VIPLRLQLGLVTVLLASSCRAQSDSPDPQVCAPPTSELLPLASAEGMGGEYRLRLVATSGSKTGSEASGKLTLQPQSGELRYRVRPGGFLDSSVVHPLYGSTDVDLAAVDAVLVGSTTSLDAISPGVLVVARHAPPGQTPVAHIWLRLGSHANRQWQQRVDGGYTALRVRQMSPAGFSGSWASGIRTEQSAGYFCAERLDE